MHIRSPVTDNCPSCKSGRRNESMLPDRVSNPGLLTYESGALPIALRGPATGSRLFGLVVEHWIIDPAARVRFQPKSWDFYAPVTKVRGGIKICPCLSVCLSVCSSRFTVWSLCNQLLPQFQMDLFETLHICCGHI